MVGIYTYENGLKFTGLIADSEKEAWEYLDDIYGQTIHGVKYPCKHKAFKIMPLKKIKKK